ncbi:unnamed protein product, partial [Heterosigma akashiwo]
CGKGRRSKLGACGGLSPPPTDVDEAIWRPRRRCLDPQTAKGGGMRATPPWQNSTAGWGGLDGLATRSQKKPLTYVLTRTVMQPRVCSGPEDAAEFMLPDGRTAWPGRTEQEVPHGVSPTAGRGEALEIEVRVGAPGASARDALGQGACDRAPERALGRAGQDGPPEGDVRPWKKKTGAPLPPAGGAKELTTRGASAVGSEAGPFWSCCCADPSRTLSLGGVRGQRAQPSRRAEPPGASIQGVQGCQSAARSGGAELG